MLFARKRMPALASMLMLLRYLSLCVYRLCDVSVVTCLDLRAALSTLTVSLHLNVKYLIQKSEMYFGLLYCNVLHCNISSSSFRKPCKDFQSVDSCEIMGMEGHYINHITNKGCIYVLHSLGSL